MHFWFVIDGADLDCLVWLGFGFFLVGLGFASLGGEGVLYCWLVACSMFCLHILVHL